MLPPEDFFASLRAMKFLAMLLSLGIVMSVGVVHGQSQMSGTSSNLNSSRTYPGGIDEEDLKVQEDMRNPVATVDRRTIEQRVLKSYTKKVEEETSSKNKSE